MFFLDGFLDLRVAWTVIVVQVLVVVLEIVTDGQPWFRAPKCCLAGGSSGVTRRMEEIGRAHV